MNRKILVIAVAFLAVAVLATPLLGTAKACRWEKPKTIDVYTRTPGVDPPTEVFLEEIPGDLNKILCDGKLQITSGRLATVAYGSELDDRGPLGFGTKYVKTIIAIQHFSGEMITAPTGETQTMYGHGFGIFKVKYVIEGGPYGAGSLSGIERVEWEWDFSDPKPRNWRFEKWSSYSLKMGTGDFAGVRVDLETYYNMFLGYYHTKTTVIY
jgi:hypothetical protein